jgi:hypothetical protein
MSKSILQALIVVAKRPAPGKTKTRLSPPLSADQSSALYECFLFDTLELIRLVPNVHPVLAYLPENERPYFNRLAPDFELIPQEGHDLGSRLDNTMTHFFNQGFKKAVVMNSDSPTLPGSHLVKAFQNLEDDNDVVIGPCEDGGYYLIGAKRPIPKLLREVRMSTSKVTQDTIDLAIQEGFKSHLLSSWYDIDNAASLAQLEKEMPNIPGNTAVHTRHFLSQYGPFFREASA